MIGGVDTVIPTYGGASALDTCVRMIWKRWSKAVFEDAASGRRVARYEEIAFGYLKEVFVYQDERRAQEWDEKGAEPSLANTMIHLLLSEESVTLVVDDLARRCIRPTRASPPG